MQFSKLEINGVSNKLIISMVAICIIPLIVLGFGSYTQSKTILSNKLDLTSTQTLAAVDNSVSEYFYGLGNMVSLMANDDGFQDAEVEDTMEDVSNILKQVRNVNDTVLTDYFATENKKFAIYPSEKMPDGYSPLDRPWYKDAAAHPGQVSISMPFKDAKTGENVVSISKTVEHSGKVIGVVGMSVALNTLTDKIASNKIGKSGYIFMTDANGNIIAHPNKALIGTDEASKLSFCSKVKTTKEGFVAYDYKGIKKFGDYQTNEATGWKLVAALEQSELSNDTKNILQRTIFMILIIGIIAGILSWLFSRGIANNIGKLKDVFMKASTGDLTVSMDAYTKDEFRDLAESFNKMMKDISSLMISVTRSSNTVLSTSTNLANMSQTVTESIDEVAKSISQVSQGAVEQARNSQKSVTRMNDLSDKLNKVSANSSEMDTISNSTKSLGAKGLNMISMLSEKSNRTKLATNEVDKIVKDMSDRTRQINVISQTISNITDQTNLLALNASIESARAGEAGKGFAVVADEIRKLAEQSSVSTEEIKNIVANIQNSSDIAVEAIKAAENMVNEQELAVAETKEIFNQILGSIGIMIQKVDEVKISIKDMTVEKQNTIVEIENISAISEQSASASEEVTASIEEINSTMGEFTNHTNELKKLSEQLEAEINKFKTR